MNRFNGLILCSLAAATLAAASVKAQVIDQNQPNVNLREFSGMAHLSEPGLALSFIQFANNIDGAGIFLTGVGSSDNVTISLWNRLPNRIGAFQMASGTGPGVAGSWLDVFWSAVPLDPFTTYFLVFTSGQAPSSLLLAGDLDNPYANGQVYTNFAAWPSYDYTFRTYQDPDFPRSPVPDSTVPEPVTMVLLGTGLLAVGAAARRRRKKDLDASEVGV